MAPFRTRVSLLATVALLLAAPVHGQVVKCLDAATGRVTYTQGSCAAHETLAHVLKTPAVDTSSPDHGQARPARERQAPPPAPAMPTATAPSAAAGPEATSMNGPPSGAPGSAACARALRNLEVAQRSITRTDKPLSELAEVETACGTDVQGYAKLQRDPSAHPQAEPVPTAYGWCRGAACRYTHDRPHHHPGKPVVSSAAGRSCPGVRGPHAACSNVQRDLPLDPRVNGKPSAPARALVNAAPPGAAALAVPPG